MSQLSDCEKKTFEPRFPFDHVHLLMCDDLYVNEHFKNSVEIIEFKKKNGKFTFFPSTREPWFTFYSSTILI